MPDIYVLRLGHRIYRDFRVSTHCALVAYAYGASGIIFSGEKDGSLIEEVTRTVRLWGGNFKVTYEEDWRGFVTNFKRSGGFIIHSTMYGINLPDAIDGLREKVKEKDALLIVGSQKVPSDVYKMADANIAVTNLPHSEVASIATILDWIFQGKELSRKLPDAKMRIIPQEKGKKVVKNI
ncbi:MAG: tRNA (cytidine(56)-2'-O)-methyltransferase [Thermoproteota archaeon]